MSASVAHGLQNLSEAAPSDLVLKSLDDPDAGVRKLALKTTAMLKRSELSRRVAEIEKSDPAEHLRSAATLAAKQLTPSTPAKKAAPK